LKQLVNSDIISIAMFASVAAREHNPKWSDFIKREDVLYSRRGDTRSEFARDYNRILHCTAYRRLKHKTQVFFAPENDHVCTRIEHVNHVTAISYTISKVFELNTGLTNAIAIGHDLGHTPFGHAGQDILNEIAKDNIADKFWHEKNSLWFVDNIETLPNPDNKEINLLLTYAVRDGIVCHCGEVDKDSIYPRSEIINLHEILQPDQVQPFTWEGCVVKVADKIAFLGRDIEDAIRLGILSLKELLSESKEFILYLEDDPVNIKPRQINNTALIHCLVSDLCKSSSPECGIRFTENRLALLKGLDQLSKKLIYNHHRLKQYEELAKLVLQTIFKVLRPCYAGRDTIKELNVRLSHYTLLRDSFSGWITQYNDINQFERTKNRFENKIIYNMENEYDYIRAIIDYIAGMTDNFAHKAYDEITRFM